MNDPSMTLPIDRSHSPPFHQLDWQKWERLTVAVFELEPQVATSDPYGISGQQQYGIDVMGRRTEGDGEEVVSCKLTQTITPADLAGWSDDFLKHRDTHWHQWSIRRFIIATTATNTGDRKIQDQIKIERARFAESGVCYELWGPAQFVAKLRTQRAIVAAYLPDFVEIICGPVANQASEQTGASNLLPQMAVAQLGELQRALSGQVAKRAADAQEALRAGNRTLVHELVSELRAPMMWAQLEAGTQATVVRLQAALNIQENRLEEASRLAEEARQLEPGAERRTEAQIALRASGPEAALVELGAPSTIPGRQLKATLLLMTAADDEVEAILDELHLEPSIDAETWRLTALHRLTRRDRAGALDAIQQAEAQAPAWVAVLQAGVIVRYAQALSPAVDREWFFYPNPIDAALVIEEQEAQRHLEGALALISVMERAEDERTDAALWKLAVLSNLKGKYDAASEHARATLAEAPADATAIAWCINRHLDVELEPSLEQLKSDYIGGSSVQAIRILGVLLINLEREDEAEFLTAHLATQGADEREEAERWIARIRGRPEKDEENAFADVLRRGRDTGDWSDAIELARARLDEEPPQIEGLTLAQALAEAQEWQALGPIVERLPLYETAAAIRLAAYILFNNDRYEPMLSLLEAHAYSFGGAVPEDLRHLKAEAFLRLGRPQHSLRELEQIGASQPLDLKLLGAQARAHLGDVRATVPIVREALRSNNLTGAHALHWSQLLQTEAPELARELWRHASHGESRDQLAVALMNQAFRLGLDKEVSSLMPIVQAKALGGSPEIRATSLDEVRTLLETRNAGANEVLTQFQNGALPAHLVVRDDDAAYLRLLIECDPSEPRLRPRLIRSGARPSELKIDDDWLDLAVHLDVSGLIIAGKLELLDHLEQTREPVRISPQLPPILLRMELGVQPIQPTELAARRAIWACFTEGTIDVSDARDVNEQTLTITGKGDEPAPVDGLIRGLEAAKLLQAGDVPEALASAGDLGGEALVLDGVTEIRLDFFALLSVARAELLPLLTRNFRLVCTSEVKRAVQLEIERGAEQDRLAEFVQKLRQRVADNLASGRFVMLEPGPGMLATEDSGPLVRALEDLLQAERIDHGVVWFDDRLISSYPRSKNMPVVGVYEVLQTLAAQGRLSEEEYAQKLMALRELGACFIPLEDKEILQALRSAPCGEDGIGETRELVALRRSFCAAGLLEPHLQISTPGNPNPDNRPDEFEYPRSVMRLLGDCLGAIWTNPPIDVDRAYAESDWLWRTLRVTQLDREIPGDDPRGAQDFFEVMQIGHLLDKAIDIGGWRDERKALREAYLHWVWERCVRSSASADPSFIDRIGTYLTDFYRALLDDARKSRSKSDASLYGKLILLRLQQLPEPVRKRVLDSGKLRELGGIYRTITLGKAQFAPVAFWRAVRRAKRYGKARLRTTERRLIRVRSDGEVLLFGPPLRARLEDGLNAVVAARPAGLVDSVRQYLSILDIDPKARPDVLRSAATMYGQPHRLADVFAEFRESAPAHRYKLVIEKLRKRQPFDAELLLPAPADRLIRHLGLTTASEDGIVVEAVIETLADRVGLTATFQRIGGIPVPMPNSLFADTNDGRLLDLASSTVTPIRLIHLLTEAKRRDWGTERIETITERLIDCVENSGALLLSLLRWSEKAFRRDPLWVAMPEHMQLALVWAHADRLLHALVTNHSAGKPMMEFLDAHGPTLSAPAIMVASVTNRDQGSPAHLSATALLYHGLGAAFGETDLTTALSQPTLDRIFGILRANVGEVLAPEFTLMRRRRNAPDALKSFLREAPVGILHESLDPEETRDALIDAALESLERDEGDREASLMQLSAFATMGLDGGQLERLHAFLQSADIHALAFGPSGFQPVRWRALLGSITEIDGEWVRDELLKLAAQCSQRKEPVLVGKQAESACEQLIEIAATVAAKNDSDPVQRLSDLFLGIALNWPATADRLRAIVDDLLTITRASDSKALWQLRYQLGSMR